MRTLTFAVLAVSLATYAGAETVVYKVQHRRPSFLLGTVSGEVGPSARAYDVAGPKKLVEAGLHVKADDAAGTITIDGAKQDCEGLKSCFRIFDVSPRMVTMQVTISSKVDKYESKTTTQVSNNSTWTLGDERLGLSLAVSPRINGDGTVTGYIKYGAAGAENSLVTRVKLKGMVRLGIAADGSLMILSAPKLKPADEKAPEIEATICFSSL